MTSSHLKDILHFSRLSIFPALISNSRVFSVGQSWQTWTIISLFLVMKFKMVFSTLPKVGYYFALTVWRVEDSWNKLRGSSERNTLYSKLIAEPESPSAPSLQAQNSVRRSCPIIDSSDCHLLFLLLTINNTCSLREKMRKSPRPWRYGYFYFLLSS